jgi:hypothetical protein
VTAGESAALGFAFIGAGLGLIAWAYRSQAAWVQGKGRPRATSFGIQPWAPGQKRIIAGLLLILFGAILAAPFIMSIR